MMRIQIAPIYPLVLFLIPTFACIEDEAFVDDLRAEDEFGVARDPGGPLAAIPVDPCRRQFRSIGGECIDDDDYYYDDDDTYEDDDYDDYDFVYDEPTRPPRAFDEPRPPRSSSEPAPEPPPLTIANLVLPSPDPIPQDSGVCEIVTVDPIVLWPPSHKPEAFAISDCVVALSGCEAGEVDFDEALEIVSLSSDEYENGNGDGNTCDDTIMITSASTFEVRAERAGGGDGRVYTIELRYTDEAEHDSYATCQVVVPTGHNVPAVDSGCQLCLDAEYDDADFCGACAYTSEDC